MVRQLLGKNEFLGERLRDPGMNCSYRKCESDLWVIVYFVCATREFSHIELYMCEEGVSDTWGQLSHRPGSLYSCHQN